MNKKVQLDKIMSSKYARAKVWFLLARLLQWVIVILAIFAIVTNTNNAIAIGLVGFLSPLGVMIFEEIGQHYYAKGERLRRLYLLQQSLGHEPSEAELLEILSRETPVSPSEPKPIGDGYYSSSTSSGFSRLFYRVEESAFWTAELSWSTAIIHYVVAGLGIMISLLIAFFALQQTTSSSGVDFSRLFSTLLVFFIAGSTMASARSYHALSSSASKVIADATKLRKQTTVDPIDLYVLLSAYDSALAKAHPIPSYVYGMRQKKLQAAWDVSQRADNSSR